MNGRSYPDTVTSGPLETMTADGQKHFSQPMSAIINIPAGKKALLRISDLDTNEHQTLASLGIPMKVIAQNARLLRDQAGNNLYYNTNSITLGGGESIDVLSGCQRYDQVSVGQRVLSLHSQSGPPVERRRELRRADDRGPDQLKQLT